MAERKALSKKIRFEIFKRDSFTCQYCGRMAPDVVLEVDHINPIFNNGDNEIMNLLTSCFDCNRGKGKKQLSDNSVIKLQQEQLKTLNEKRQQLEMMIEWKKQLQDFINEEVLKIEDLFNEQMGFRLSNYGKSVFKKHIIEFGFSEVYESSIISINQYYNESNEDTVSQVINKVGGICCNRKKKRDKNEI